MKVGGVDINFLGHSGFLIEVNNENGKRIAIDPYNVSENIGKVDLILITHSHYDHCSIKDIERLAKEGTLIVIGADSQSKITRINKVKMKISEIGDKINFGNIKIDIIPSYTIDKPFHPKKEGWFGFIIKIKETIIYHAGDTDKIPEMKNLTGYGKDGNTFITLLPVSGTYCMDYEEAAEVAKMLKPDLAIPMHYGAGVAGNIEDAKKFVELCKDYGINSEVLEKI